MSQEVKLYLARVENIFRHPDGTVSIRSNEGNVTRSFERPRQGLHLKEGDLIIRHERVGFTIAIDKVVAINGNAIKIRRVLGKIKDVSSLKGRYVKLSVFCE